jgi:hypothetical protein
MLGSKTLQVVLQLTQTIIVLGEKTYVVKYMLFWAIM